MNISDLLKPSAVIVSLKAQGKKHLLQEIAARAAQVTRLPERKIFETLMERERLGTTGVGQGIAIPHGRLADISEIVGVFARLETPIDYRRGRQSAGRSRVHAACARRCRRRSPEGAWRAYRACCAIRPPRKSCAPPRPREALYAILTDTTGSSGAQAA